ncbi:dsDNA nuclease domain-containing protein [Streptomyces phaeochromogenes]|uniref:dsDNA nuclease domain-containing protein n=1 Tax=Streptomyces phaeochromogenes TaxID=1923 RepID=UPI0006E38950|nr:dsDNA nuclease domain-containing protein [Streptomyces phaeochromogenes]
MQDPGRLPAPDNTGSATEVRFTYQAQAALRGVLEMLAGGGVLHVTCEHFEDVLVARTGGVVSGGVALWDFQQIKSRKKQDSWTLSKVLRSKALASLLRTHRALREHKDLPYVLTVGVEGPLSSEADVLALAQGQGGDSTKRLGRIARHLAADAAEAAEFLRLVRIEELPDRYELERRNRDVLFALAPHLRAGDVEVLHADLLNRVRLAMSGSLGPRWQALVTQPDVPEPVLRKRLTPQKLRDVALRLTRPDLADYVRASRLAAQTHPYPEAGQAGVPSLSSVYVPQRLHRVSSENGRRRDSPADQSPGDVADASALLGHAPMCLVLAGPGGGKSSLLRAVQADSAERWPAREDQRMLGVTVPATALLGSPLPNALAAAATTQLAASALQRTLSDELFLNRPAPGACWLVLVDGLDEITDPDDRQNLLRTLANFAAGPDPLYRFVVATRPLPGKDLRILGHDVPRYQLVPFSRSELSSAAQRVLDGLGIPDSRDAAGRFVRMLDDAHLTGFARTPLMATMLCQLYAADPGQSLPATRGALYARFTDLLRHRMSGRGLSGVRSQAEAALACFGPTAVSRAHDLLDQLPDTIDNLAYDHRSGSVTSWVDALAALDSARRPRAVPQDNWNGFLASVLGRSGLLTHSGDGFTFLHQTLQEYCAARHLARTPSAHARELDRLLGPWEEDWGTTPWGAPLDTASYIGFLIDPGTAPPTDPATSLEALAVPDNIRGCLLIATQLSLGTLLADTWKPLVQTAAQAMATASTDDDSDATSRVWAASVLAELDLQEGITALETLVDDRLLDEEFNEDPHSPDFSDRLLAARSLLELDAVRGRDACHRLVRDSHLYESVRVRAAEVLLSVGDERARPALVYLAGADIHFDDRLEAANRLSPLDPEAAVRALHKLIEDYRGDPDWLDWCVAAAQALTELGDPRGRQITGELSTGL